MLQVDRKPENIAELEAGVDAGRTVDDWQMPKGSKPGDLVIWYAAGRQEYIALGWVDAVPRLVKEGPGPYRGPVGRMQWIEPVSRRKVIRDCGLDGGVESYQTVEEGLVADLLESLGLSQLTSIPGKRSVVALVRRADGSSAVSAGRRAAGVAGCASLN